MKIRLQNILEFELDISKERERVIRLFTGDVQERQLNLLQLFEDQQFDQMHDFYDSLPRDEEDGTPEQEYTGFWYGVLFCGHNPYHLTSKKYPIRLVKDIAQLIVDGELKINHESEIV